MNLIYRSAAVMAGIVIVIVIVSYWNPRQSDMVCDASQDRICQQRFVHPDQLKHDAQTRILDR
jgi:hypothetical protein